MEKDGLSLEEAALKFLTSLPPEERTAKHQEVNRFVLWYSKDRPISQVTATEVANYAQWVGASTADAAKKLEPVRAFLTFAKKEKLVKASLAPHLRIKQGSAKPARPPKPKQQVALTAADYADLKAQLTSLEEERLRVAEEMRIAAADKDFRENAPLQAARERRDQIEARMKAIQASIATGVLVDTEATQQTLVVKLGCRVTLHELSSGKHLSYTLVTKNEASPANGKISIASPIGKALLNQPQNAVIKVAAPAGEMSYRIEGIEGS